MRLIVNRKHMFHRELRVSLSGGQPFVTEHLLNGAEIGTFLKHVSAKGMTQSMRVNLWRETLGQGDTLYDPSNAPRGEPTAPLIDQERRGVFLYLDQSFLASGKICRERSASRVPKRHIAFLLPFPSNQNSFVSHADIVEIDANQFRVADTAAIEQFQHEAITFRK